MSEFTQRTIAEQSIPGARQGTCRFIHAAKSGTYLRRGELKPRITFERQIKDFVWLSVQAGLRYNWRFDAYRTQNPQGRDEKPVAENRLGNPLYFNVSLNLVSP